MENHILLIDDDEDERVLLEMALRNCIKRTCVHQVMQFEEAITFADTFSSIPALIFLDLRLPEISGLDILTWIRNHNRLKDVPVVVWSHAASDDDIEKTHLQGGNFYLSKIADQPTLRKSVDYICDSWLR